MTDRRQIIIRMPADLHAQLFEVAEREERSVAQQVRHYIRQGLAGSPRIVDQVQMHSIGLDLYPGPHGGQVTEVTPAGDYEYIPTQTPCRMTDCDQTAEHGPWCPDHFAMILQQPDYE